MNNLFVKICGITRAQDAELAADLGATALGFVFWPNSPRRITAETVRAMTANVSARVLKVGVFVDQPVADVARTMEVAGLDVAQLHGHESPEYCRQLMVELSGASRSPGPSRVSPALVEVQRATASHGTVFKAIGIAGNGATTIDDYDPDVVLLVDAHDPARFGGTGRTVNWDTAREIAASRSTILAGGLNAANIKLAIRSVRPYGVDVSSGVESAPGVKDPNRLRAFFEALHD